MIEKRMCEWQETGQIDKCGKAPEYFDRTGQQTLCAGHAKIAGFGMGHFCEPYYSPKEDQDHAGKS